MSFGDSDGSNHKNSDDGANSDHDQLINDAEKFVAQQNGYNAQTNSKRLKERKTKKSTK